MFPNGSSWRPWCWFGSPNHSCPSSRVFVIPEPIGRDIYNYLTFPQTLPLRGSASASVSARLDPIIWIPDSLVASRCGRNDGHGNRLGLVAASTHIFSEHMPSALAQLDNDAARLQKLVSTDEEVVICVLGQAAVGKSTVLNSLVAQAETLLPAGGIGPLDPMSAE
jgi:hypothetical protein